MLKFAKRLFMSSISRKIDIIEEDIKCTIGTHAREQFWVTHYGATDIDPMYLVIWICVQSDAEKQRLAGDRDLLLQLRSLLTKHDYPAQARDQVYIGYESQETVDMESGSNWWHHWK
jgi:hypothetical protein